MICDNCKNSLPSLTHDDILNVVYCVSNYKYKLLMRHIIENKSCREIAKDMYISPESVSKRINDTFESIIFRLGLKGIKISQEEIKAILWENREKLKGIEKTLNYSVSKDFSLGRNSDPVVIQQSFPIIKKNDTELRLQSIDCLDLSIRSHNCLINAGIKTIGELLDTKPSDLYRIKNLGLKALNEIKQALIDLEQKPNFSPIEKRLYDYNLPRE